MAKKIKTRAELEKEIRNLKAKIRRMKKDERYPHLILENVRDENYRLKELLKPIKDNEVIKLRKEVQESRQTKEARELLDAMQQVLKRKPTRLESFQLSSEISRKYRGKGSNFIKIVKVIKNN